MLRRQYFHRYTEDALDLCAVLGSYVPGAKVNVRHGPGGAQKPLPAATVSATWRDRCSPKAKSAAVGHHLRIAT